MESRFAAIAQRALRDAEAVNVGFDEFVQGLRDMSEEINGALWLAEDTVAQKLRAGCIEGEVIE